jgi:thymidylate kinase
MIHIALEGIDGCGKSTQLLRLTSLLAKAGVNYDVYSYTQKRNSTIRFLIERWRRWCGHGGRPLAFHERLVQEMLYATNARRNWHHVNLNRELIVSDRSILTALAAHRNLIPWTGLSLRFVRCIEWSIPVPHGVILLNIHPDVANARIIMRGNPRNADENLVTAEAMQAMYHRFYEDPPLTCLSHIKWVIIDSNPPEKVVAWHVSQALVHLLEKCGAERMMLRSITDIIDVCH